MKKENLRKTLIVTPIVLMAIIVFFLVYVVGSMITTSSTLDRLKEQRSQKISIPEMESIKNGPFVLTKMGENTVRITCTKKGKGFLFCADYSGNIPQRADLDSSCWDNAIVRFSSDVIYYDPEDNFNCVNPYCTQMSDFVK